ncbi:hypothetical protein QF027_005570 [Streptomyces canus]|nr:hypothetical protein [Streptomyces canus]
MPSSPEMCALAFGRPSSRRPGQCSGLRVRLGLGLSRGSRSGGSRGGLLAEGVGDRQWGVPVGAVRRGGRFCWGLGGRADPGAGRRPVLRPARAVGARPVQGEPFRRGSWRPPRRRGRRQAAGRAGRGRTPRRALLLGTRRARGSWCGPAASAPACACGWGSACPGGAVPAGVVVASSQKRSATGSGACRSGPYAGEGGSAGDSAGARILVRARARASFPPRVRCSPRRRRGRRTERVCPPGRTQVWCRVPPAPSATPVWAATDGAQPEVRTTGRRSPGVCRSSRRGRPTGRWRCCRCSR